MATKKATCTNCERPNLAIANGRGHCHTCHGAGKGLEGEDLRIALVNVKYRLKVIADGISRPEETETNKTPSGEIAKIKRPARKEKDKHATEKNITGTIAPVAPSASIHTSSALTLQFLDDVDLRILSYVESEAKRCRRTTDQQALFMLQSHLPESRGLCPPPQATSSISQEA